MHKRRDTIKSNLEYYCKKALALIRLRVGWEKMSSKEGGVQHEDAVQRGR